VEQREWAGGGGQLEDIFVQTVAATYGEGAL
jgi:hypothetical protein